ncbi:MAG TPA: ABC transporter ATP-binding protein, partial [Sulfitobacter sp.]|nr:ABC transporter ATP-binding protein [Sulfitobacter sp.]
MTEVLLDVRNLHKSFGALKATDDVSITLRPGEIHALIGPNGAG